MFNYGSLDIECKATFSDFLFEKKNLRLTKKENSQQPYRPGYSNPSRTQPERPRTSSYGTFNNAINSDQSHDVIHNRLLDLLDPKKHMHPGVPYDFYSGYILMVAKNVEEEISRNQFQGDLPAPDITMQLDANKQIENVLNEARKPERQKLERELEDVK